MDDNKPLILAVEEAKKRIYAAITDEIRWGLPCYFLSHILESALAEVKEGAAGELQAATKKYKKESEETQNDKLQKQNDR